MDLVAQLLLASKHLLVKLKEGATTRLLRRKMLLLFERKNIVAFIKLVETYKVRHGKRKLP